MFTFRLQTLLKVRETTRDYRRAELAKAYAALQVLEAQQAQLEGELEDLHRSATHASEPGEVDVDRLTRLQRHRLLVQAQIDDVKKNIHAVQEEVDVRRQALVEADRQVKVLEKLRDKQLQRHQYEENRRETKRLDEIAQNQRGRVALR